MRKVDKIIISSDIAINEAIKIIDKGRLGIALIADYDRRLKGIITDVDVRRGILKGVSLDASAEKIMNRKPIVAFEDASQEEIIDLMKQYHIRQIPVIDRNKKIKGLEIINDYFHKTTYSNKVVIMAGGIGKRLYPLTKDIPKPLLPIGGRPILENLIISFREQGFRNFIIALSYKKEQIKRYFKNGAHLEVNIEYCIEKQPLGTAGAIALLKNYSIKEAFFVVNADLVTSVNFEVMLDYHNRHNDIATVGIKEYSINIPYGVVNLKDSVLLGFEEKPSRSFYVNAGIYIFEPKILRMVSKVKSLDMISLLERLRKKFNVRCFPIREYWLDVGHYENYRKAKRDFKEVFGE